MKYARKKFKKSEKILDDLKIILKCSNDLELSRSIDIAASTLSSWRKRGNIDIAKILPYLAKYDIDLNEFLYETENSDSYVLNISEQNSKNDNSQNENEYLKKELKKIDTEILEARGETIENVANACDNAAAIPHGDKEVQFLRNTVAQLTQIINKLSAKTS